MPTRRLGTDKEIEKVARIARKQKWEVTVTGGNHLKWVPPLKKDKVVISGLTGCGPGWIKARNQLQKAGLKL